ncbi:MAG: MGDG synthase family glycosyltransferase [Anaerolineales bacterium]|jgi:1,2-diacylglycerol 3-beta-galactosyltransferase
MTDTRPLKMLILFADYGYGHRSAALAVHTALQHRYGDQVQAEMVNPIDDNTAPKFLRDEQQKYDQRVTGTPNLYRLTYELSEKKISTTLTENAMIVLLHETMTRALDDIQPDVIVTTYPLYLAPLSGIFSIKRMHYPIITVVTDFTSVNRIWFNPISDFTTVPTEAARSIGLARGIESDQIRMTGIPVHPRISLENRQKAEIRRELGWNPDLVTILAVGSTRVRNLKETLHVINHAGFSLQLAIVAGGDDRLYTELSQMEWHHESHLYNRVNNIPTMMHAADLILCKAGGLITSEALACGLPLLYVDVIEGQETGNAEYIVKEGAGELVTTPLEALETLCHWLDHDGEMLQQKADNARRIGSPQAAFEIADMAYHAAEQGPHPLERSIFNMERLTNLLANFKLPEDAAQTG